MSNATPKTAAARIAADLDRAMSAVAPNFETALSYATRAVDCVPDYQDRLQLAAVLERICLLVDAADETELRETVRVSALILAREVEKQAREIG